MDGQPQFGSFEEFMGSGTGPAGPQANAAPEQPQQFKSFDDFMAAPDAKEQLAQKQGAVSKIISDFGQGFNQSTGNYQNLAGSPGTDTEAFLKEHDLMNDYVKGENNILKGFVGGPLTSAAASLDAAMRTAGGVFISGPIGAIGGVIHRTGAGDILANVREGEEAAANEPQAISEMVQNSPFLGELHGAPKLEKPKPFTPTDLASAKSAAVLDSQDVYMGVKDATPEQEVAQRSAASEAEPITSETTNSKPVEPQDIHTVARQLAPETFNQYDRLSARTEDLRSQLNDLSDARTADLDAQIKAIQEAKSGGYGKLQSLLEKKQAIVDAGDTPEMASIRQKIQTTDYQLRDLAPEVSTAMKAAEAHIGVAPEAEISKAPETQEPNLAGAEGATKIGEVPDQLKLGDESPKQNIDIAADVSKNLIDAGRPAEEANASAQLIAEHYKAISEQGWAKGTPEEIYTRDMAKIKAGKGVAKAKELAQESGSRTAEDLSQHLSDKYGIDVALHETGKDLHLASIKVLEGERGEGIGTKAMQDIIDYADENGKRITLTPTTDFGASSVSRLKKFYKQFGFVENKGKNKDFSTRESMLRDPKLLDQSTHGKIRLASAAADGKAAITLMKTANASTFIHEIGHHWLDEMMTYAKEDDAPQSLLDSVKSVRKYLGAKEGDFSGFTRAQHEKFARGFERYLMEGAAPSKALAGVFAKFKQWLTTIYQTAQKLRSPISEDIRDVFDRLLSSKPERTIIAPDREASLAGNINDNKLKDVFGNVPKPPQSLTEWLADKGGLKDETGDLKAMDADKAHIDINTGKAKPFVKKLVQDDGMGLDDAARAAQEAGYFPEKGGERPTIDELLAKVREDLSGDKKYSDKDHEILDNYEESLKYNAEVDKISHETGIDYEGKTHDQFWDEVAKHYNYEKLYTESQDMAEDARKKYEELENKERELAENRGEAWEPEKNNSRTLEDLENERKQEIAANNAAKGATNNKQSPVAAGSSQPSEASVGQGGGGAEHAGRNDKTRGETSGNAERSVKPDPAAPNAKFERSESSLVDKAGNIRLDNLNTPEDVNAVLRQTAKDNDGFTAARRGVLSVGDQLNLADALGMRPSDLDFRKIGQAFNAEQIIAARKLLIQSATNVRDIMNRGDVMAYAEAKQRHLMIQEQVAGLTAEAGRALGAFRKLDGAEGAKALGNFLKQSTGKDLFQLQQEMEFGRSLETPAQVAKFLDASKKAGFKNMVLEYYINCLISGPITHLRYSVGNAINALAAPLLEIPMQAAIGAIRGSADRVYLGEAGAQLHGLMKGSRDGLQAAIKAFQTGQSPLLPTEHMGLNFADEPRVNAIPGSIGRVINIPSKSVAAIHSFFKSLRYEQNIQGLAYREATKAGLEGDAFAAKVADLSTNPTEDMMKTATSGALKELYMAPTDYNSFMGSLAKAVNSNMAAKIIIPFMKIGSQITRNAFIERTPLGLLDKDVRANVFGENGGAAMDQQLGKMAVGTALMGTTALMTLEGNATGDGPSDPGQRAIWLMNHRPNSIQIGGITIPYQGLGHLGMLMRFAANMTETAHGWNGEDGGKLATSFLEGVTKSVLDENFMRGLKDMLDAIYHPEEYGDAYLRSFATNWLPFSVGMAQVAKQIDPYQRDINSKESMAAQIFDQARSKIPFVSEGLEPKRDRFGEPIPNGAPSARYQNDPTVQRMESLNIGIGKLEKKINGVPLTDAQYDSYSKTAGQLTKLRLDQIVPNQAFGQIPVANQIKFIKETIESSREVARKLVMMQNPDIMQKSTQNKLNTLKGR